MYGGNRLSPPEDAPSWWTEWQLWLVLAVAALAVLPRIDAVPFRGEEHRRVQVAAEMAARGDWVVPREQGQVFLSRPPLQQWVLGRRVGCFPITIGSRRGSRARWRCLLIVAPPLRLLPPVHRPHRRVRRRARLSDHGRDTRAGPAGRDGGDLHLPDVLRAHLLALGVCAGGRPRRPGRSATGSPLPRGCARGGCSRRSICSVPWASTCCGSAISVTRSALGILSG